MYMTAGNIVVLLVCIAMLIFLVWYHHDGWAKCESRLVHQLRHNDVLISDNRLAAKRIERLLISGH